MEHLLANKPPTTLEEIIDYVCPDTGESLVMGYAVMSAPCLRGGRLLATDGKVGLSLPPELADVEAEDNPNYPDLEAIMTKTFGGERVAEVGRSALEKALGKVPQKEVYDRETCEKCGGDGYEMCPCCGQTAECNSCGGEGTWEGELLGRRYSERYTLVFHGQHYRPKFIFLALCLARILDAVRLGVYLAPHGDAKALGLQIGPARLVVMPVYVHSYDGFPDYQDHIEVVGGGVEGHPPVAATD